MSVVLAVRLSAGEIRVVEHEGQPYVVLKHAIEELGLDWKSQYAKLKSRAWACVVQKTMRLPGDTQASMYTIGDVKTFLMLLATIREVKVKPEFRAILVAYQVETSDALEVYWSKGAQESRAECKTQLEHHSRILKESMALTDEWSAELRQVREAARQAAAVIENQLARIDAGVPPLGDPKAPNQIGSADDRKVRAVTAFRAAQVADPRISQAAFVRAYNIDRPDREPPLNTAYLCRALKRFP